MEKTGRETFWGPQETEWRKKLQSKPLPKPDNDRLWQSILAASAR